MSRFVDELRERSRRAGHVATGYRMAGARDLALAADTVSHHCRNAADAIEALERAEKLARDAETVVVGPPPGVLDLDEDLLARIVEVLRP